MNYSTSPIHILVGNIAIQSPILLVCIAAIVVTILRWNDATRGSVWAVLGFGLACALCLIIPVAQMLTQQWMMRAGHKPEDVATVYQIQAVVWAILRAMSYVFLVLAVFAGRSSGPPLLRVAGPSA